MNDNKKNTRQKISEPKENLKVLVVDDDKIARKIIVIGLAKRGYNVLQADNGLTALEIIESENVGVVLADWMMPCMDGLELCRRIRANENPDYIYILMLTSKSQKKDMLEGFKAGVDNYLNKPPDFDELQAHIGAGMRMVSLERSVAKYAGKMEALANERAKQLVVADRMATLGTMSAGIAHEINNPTTFISGNVQMLEKFWPIIKDIIKTAPSNHPDASKFDFILKEVPGIIDGINNGTERIIRIVNGLKSFSHHGQSIENEPFDVHESIDAALLLCANTLKYNVEVTKNFDENLKQMNGDKQQIEQVFVNFFTNAAHATENIDQGHLAITTKKKETTIEIQIEDNGAGIKPEIMDKIWNPFYTTKHVGKGTGLGLSISLGIIQSHDGDIKVYNKPEGGAVFVLTLPA